MFSRTSRNRPELSAAERSRWILLGWGKEGEREPKIKEKRGALQFFQKEEGSQKPKWPVSRKAGVR